MPHLSKLTPIHIRALVRLDDGHGHMDSVGQEAERLSDAVLVACYELSRMGLVEASSGWRGTVWFRLTARGRTIREVGRT
ncbi:hypothetical protein [Aureimonas sp. Leaf324]|uniref:hypothetical protein n=1 Tax=Aureimonas sp. Leaf324 TaxID=1736336 RepID=UPI0006F6BF02|nr:hypothetical protein [Aureimonas sp. Leaf324]KQQ81920.1 hypothetical protein ASF65_07650 [Aureimonas sp. Leaf324]